MNIALAKIRGDLIHRPSRSLLIAFAVCVGASILSAALASMFVLSRAIPASFTGALPPTHILSLKVDSRAVQKLVAAIPEVSAVEERRVLRGRVETSGGRLASARLIILPDLSSQTVSRVIVETGDASGVLIERSSLAILGSRPGEPVVLRLPGGGVYRMATTGVAADGAVAPGIQDRIVYLYATPEAVASLGPLAKYDELHVRLAQDAPVSALLSRLEAEGIGLKRVEEVLQRHPHADQMHAVILLLVLFALASLVIVSFLVANVVYVAMQTEMQWIGVQKALGSSSRRVMMTVLGWVVAVGFVAVLAGTAIGAVAANAFLSYTARELNLVEVSLSPSPWILLLGGIVSLFAPLLAAAAVSRRASHVRPLDAMLPQRKRHSRERTFASHVDVARSYVWRNLHSSPVRGLLAICALAGGGAALLCAGNAYSSLAASVDRVFDYRKDDLDLRLPMPVPAEKLVGLSSIPNVKRVELWGGMLVSLAKDDPRVTGTRFGLLAPPADTKFLKLPVAEGRWLNDSTASEVVAARSLLARENLDVGDRITLAYGDSRVPVTVVGAVEEATEPGIFATEQVSNFLTNKGLVGSVRVSVSGGRADVARKIEDEMFTQGIVPIFAMDREELRHATKNHFVILLVLLGTIGTSSLFIGGVAIWSSVSVSIIERKREIAVMRAIGASNSFVRNLFALESSLVALFAIILSLLIAVPFSAGLATMLGKHALHIDVNLQFSWTAFGLWLSLLGLVCALATLIPVQREFRAPPAKSLSYE